MFQQVENEHRCLSRINTVVRGHGSTIVRAGTLLPSLGLLALKAQYLHAQSVLNELWVNETWCTLSVKVQGWKAVTVQPVTFTQGNNWWMLYSNYMECLCVHKVPTLCMTYTIILFLQNSLNQILN